jgi:hypothetical protein
MRQTEEKNAANTVAKALIDIIAQCICYEKKSGSEFMRGHLINLQLHSLALKLSHNKYTKKGDLRNINLHDRQLCHSALQEIDFDCYLIFT